MNDSIILKCCEDCPDYKPEVVKFIFEKIPYEVSCCQDQGACPKVVEHLSALVRTGEN